MGPVTKNLKELQTCFDILGGIPRYIFAGEKTCRDRVKLAASTVGRDIINDLGDKTIATSVDMDISYSLLHMKSEDNTYENCLLNFATAHVAEHFMDIHTSEGLFQLLGLYNSNKYGLARGNIFEYISHGILGSSLNETVSGLKHCNRKINFIDAEMKKFLTADRKLTDVYKNLNEVNFRENVYYRPSVSNNPSFDSFFILNGTVFVFQTTSADSHHVTKSDNLETLCSCIKSAGRKHSKFILVFVVPDGTPLADNFKLQKIEGQSWSPSSIGFMNINQTVLKVKLPSTFESSALGQFYSTDAYIERKALFTKLPSMSFQEVKEACASAKLPVNGNKSTLLLRLFEKYGII